MSRSERIMLARALIVGIVIGTSVSATAGAPLLSALAVSVAISAVIYELTELGCWILRRRRYSNESARLSISPCARLILWL